MGFFLSPSAPWAGAITLLLGFFLALSDASETAQGLGVLAVIAGFAVFAISSSMRASEDRRRAAEDAYERGRRDAAAELEEREEHEREPL